MGLSVRVNVLFVLLSEDYGGGHCRRLVFYPDIDYLRLWWDPVGLAVFDLISCVVNCHEVVHHLWLAFYLNGTIYND